eukprot:c15814_g1_i1.p1 GENE.c15814_g1_i1~~c15814_g1_i1.p1  ORF type:complete len:104 (-),score=23.44 c15814_g1_i1:4-288(-)
MRKKFGKFMTVRRDMNRLILHWLQSLFREALSYMARSVGESQLASKPLEVSCDELEAKTREQGIHDISSFYKSQLFKSHHFVLNEDQRSIVKLM